MPDAEYIAPIIRRIDTLESAITSQLAVLSRMAKDCEQGRDLAEKQLKVIAELREAVTGKAVHV